MATDGHRWSVLSIYFLVYGRWLVIALFRRLRHSLHATATYKRQKEKLNACHYKCCLSRFLFLSGPMCLCLSSSVTLDLSRCISTSAFSVPLCFSLILAMSVFLYAVLCISIAVFFSLPLFFLTGFTALFRQVSVSLPSFISFRLSASQSLYLQTNT